MKSASTPVGLVGGSGRGSSSSGHRSSFSTLGGSSDAIVIGGEAGSEGGTVTWTSGSSTASGGGSQAGDPADSPTSSYPYVARTAAPRSPSSRKLAPPLERLETARASTTSTGGWSTTSDQTGAVVGAAGDEWDNDLATPVVVNGGAGGGAAALRDHFASRQNFTGGGGEDTPRGPTDFPPPSSASRALPRIDVTEMDADGMPSYRPLNDVVGGGGDTNVMTAATTIGGKPSSVKSAPLGSIPAPVPATTASTRAMDLTQPLTPALSADASTTVRPRAATAAAAGAGSTLRPKSEHQNSLSLAADASTKSARRLSSASGRSATLPTSSISALIGSSLAAAGGTVTSLPPGGGASAVPPSSSSAMQVTASNESTAPSLFKKVKTKVKSRRRKRKGTESSVLTNGSAETSAAKSTSSRHTKGRSRASSTASRGSYLEEDGTTSEESTGSESDDDDSGPDDPDAFSIDESRKSWDSRASSLPVTGFAVASNRRNADFHAMFPEIDEGDYLIEDYGCALQKDILVQGRIYVSEHHLSFHANIFGWVTNLVIPFRDVVALEKKMTAFVIPNAISVTTSSNKHYTFASFISRDSTYDVFNNVWRQSHSLPETDDEDAPMTATSNGTHKSPTKAKAPMKAANDHAPTTCACGRSGDHYSETAMQATFPSSPERIHELMFTSTFLKDFMCNDQKLLNIEMSDWTPKDGKDPKLLKRHMSYIKPLNGSIGPKQTKCEIADETEHLDADEYITMLTTTRTPEVPSGTVFSVKTRTCLTWAGPWSTKVVVTTKVEWTGRSFIKGIIEKSAVDGQKTYHASLEKNIREYIKQHASEFRREGDDGQPIEEEPVAEEQQEVAQTKDDAARKREDEKSALQAAIDSIITGAKSIAGGVYTAAETLGEMLEGMPITREQLLLGLVIFLVLTNFWTYTHLRSSELRTILSAAAAPRTPAVARPAGIASACEDAAGLMSALDEIERRVSRARRMLKDQGI